MQEAPDAATRILHQDDRLLAAAKPAGWETVVEGGERGRCFTSALRRALALPALFPVHRLDRDTTGLQLFAKTPAARESLEEAFRRRTVKKRYLALCLGIPRNAAATIRRPLSPWKRGKRRPVQAVKGRGGLEAETAYRVLLSFPAADRSGALPFDASLVLFEPHQGRTHQIRVHAEAIGYPLLGDNQYGDRAANRAAKKFLGLGRQALHAWTLQLTHPADPAPLSLACPPEEDLVRAWDILFPGWRDRLAEV